MEEKLLVTSSPHIRSNDTTRSIMLSVLIALAPASIYSVVIFGFRAMMIIIIGTLSSVGAEALYNVMIKHKQTVSDLSAAVSGLLLSLTLPPTVPLWLPVIGALFAMIIVKGLFGGLGQNFMNPALAARCFLFISWPQHMAVWLKPFEYSTVPLFSNVDTQAIITSVTPLKALKDMTFNYSGLADLFWGNIGGCIGETSAVLLLLGGLCLLIRKVINWRIPVFYIGVMAVLCYLFPTSGLPVQYMLAQLLSGGLLIGSIFRATDSATAPVTRMGQIIYAIGCALLTFVMRRFSGYPEGVSFAILIMNAFTWLIDKKTKPRRFGKGGAFYVKRAKEEHVAEPSAAPVVDAEE